jgi:hypothetical protein
MATSPPGSASARKSDDVMSGLEVRKPTGSARSPDLVEQVLARARTTPKLASPSVAAAAAARVAAARPETLIEIEARKPPGPNAKPAAPPPLKGTSKAAAARATAAAAAAAKALEQEQSKAQAGAQAPAKAAAPPTPAAPPAAAFAPPPGPPKAAALIDKSAPWLPEEEERKEAFLQVFRYWHAQVRPEFAHKAKPALLFLVTALPVMVKARDTLKGLNLWEPPGEHSRQQRDQHSAWKKYCEFLPRAQQALQELDDYRHLSLLSALDDLTSRVTKAEKRFREAPPPAPRKK